MLDEQLIHFPAHFSPIVAAAHFAALQHGIAWQHLFHDNPDGRRVYIPRLSANYGDESYDYSGFRFTPEPWTPRLLDLRSEAERLSGARFNALVLQLYRDGTDRVRWHADDSPRLGQDPVIVSVSFGAARTLEVRHKTRHSERVRVRLESGDVLVMRGALQHTHVHRVPREPGAGARINLTFRNILPEEGRADK